MTLDIAISTFGSEGIRRLSQNTLPELAGVRYVISWQKHENAELPSSLKREDISVYRSEHTGLSVNRNDSIRQCNGDIILISDDDIVYYAENIIKILDIFEKNPTLDIVTFRSEHGDMSRFPTEATDLKLPYPKGYYVSSIEIALRHEVAGRLKFCEELGINSKVFHGGEDEAFLLKAIKLGMRCRFFPLTICAHPHSSTGTKSHLAAGNLKAAGVVIGLIYPYSAVLRVPLKAWRIARSRQSSFFKALFNVACGALAAPGLKRRNPDSL